jgi:hypothetical protein
LCVVINLTIFLRGLTEKHQSNVVRWSAIENQEEQESEITVHVICVARDSIKLQAYRKNIKQFLLTRLHGHLLFGVLPTKRGKHTLSQFPDEKSRFPYFKEYRLDIIKDGYPVQQDNLDTSLSNVRATSFSSSAIVK